MKNYYNIFIFICISVIFINPLLAYNKNNNKKVEKLIQTSTKMNQLIENEKWNKLYEIILKGKEVGLNIPEKEGYLKGFMQITKQMSLKFKLISYSFFENYAIVKFRSSIFSKNDKNFTPLEEENYIFWIYIKEKWYFFAPEINGIDNGHFVLASKFKGKEYLIKAD